MIVHFTIELSLSSSGAEGVGFEPTCHLLSGFALAVRPGEPYPATFRIFKWTHWESNPDLRPAKPVSSRWTMSP